VISIDSVLIGNDYRKRWGIHGLIACCGNYGDIIEGIGSTGDLLLRFWSHTSPSGHETNYNLRCFMQNGIILYHPDSASSCQVVITTNDFDVNKISCSIFPNPFQMNAILKFSNPEHNICRVDIYNSLGQAIDSNTSRDEFLLISANSLSPGIYFFKISTNKNGMGSGKFVVIN
jgi:hypothetical protein